MTWRTVRQRPFPGGLSPALHLHKRGKFLLLMSIETLLLLLLIGRKFFLVPLLFHIQATALLRLVGTEG